MRILTDTAPTLTTTPVIQWGIKTIIPLILLVVGIGVIANARKGRLAENATTVSNVVLGAVVICSAGLVFAFAQTITDLATTVTK